MPSISSKPTETLLVWGLLLAVAKIFYLFFDAYNILDFLIFIVAGFVFGRKLGLKPWAWEIWLALPAMAISAFFVIRLGYDQIISGVGTSFAISILVIPIAACIGFAIGARWKKKSISFKV